MNNHSIDAFWDHSIGKVKFYIKKLDNHTRWKYAKILNGEWEMRTMYLKTRKKTDDTGRKKTVIEMILSFKAPKEEKPKNVDLRKPMYISFTDDPENAIVMATDGKFYEADKISAVEAFNWLDEISFKKKKLEKQKESVGNSVRAWGLKRPYKTITGRIAHLTKTTEEGKKYRNHAWSKRVVATAIRHCAGHIVITNLPKKVWQNYEWALYQLKSMLIYKAGKVGIKVTDCSEEQEKQEKKKNGKKKAVSPAISENLAVEVQAQPV